MEKMDWNFNSRYSSEGLGWANISWFLEFFFDEENNRYVCKIIGTDKEVWSKDCNTPPMGYSEVTEQDAKADAGFWIKRLHNEFVKTKY